MPSRARFDPSVANLRSVMNSSGKRRWWKEPLRATGKAVAGVIAPAAAPVVAVGDAVVREAGRQYQERRLQEFFKLIAEHLEDGDALGVAQGLHNNLDEPWAFEGVTQGFRKMMDECIDHRVRRAVAVMVADYLEKMSVPDDLYRRAGAFVAGCTYEHILVVNALATGIEGVLGHLDSEISDAATAAAHRAKRVEFSLADDGKHGFRVSSAAFQGVAASQRLLRRAAGLADQQFMFDLLDGERNPPSWKRVRFEDEHQRDQFRQVGRWVGAAFADELGV